MIGIYFLVSFFSYFAPQAMLWPNQGMDELEVNISFDKVSGIESGTPVVINGKAIGEVVAINEISKATHKQETKPAKNGKFEVTVKLTGVETSLVNDSTIALISQPMVKVQSKKLAKNNKAKTIVEFLSPSDSLPSIAKGKKIAGFANFEDFWSADLGKNNSKQNSKNGSKKDFFYLG